MKKAAPYNEMSDSLAVLVKVKERLLFQDYQFFGIALKLTFLSIEQIRLDNSLSPFQKLSDCSCLWFQPQADRYQPQSSNLGSGANR